MRVDSGGLEILTEAECLTLLKGGWLGRIVFTLDALPAVQPVTYAIDGRDIVIRIATRSRLAASVRDTVVAFEIDDFDGAARSGWSVVIVGRAKYVDGAEDRAALGMLALPTWTRDGEDDFVRITPEIVTGRRVL